MTYDWRIADELGDLPTGYMPVPRAFSEAIAIDAIIPVGWQTRKFMAEGAPMGAQRAEAVRAGRNLLGSGLDIDTAAQGIWQGLERSDQDPANPWTYEQAYKIVKDLASKPAPPLPPLEPAGRLIIDTDTGKVESSEGEDGTFRFAFAEQDAVIEVSRVVAGAKETLAWVRVLVGGEERSGVECELRTTRGVTSMWRYFKEWGDERPWVAMLEHARRTVLVARRTGGVVMHLRDVPAEAPIPLRIAPLILNGHLNVMFAAGGSGKSMLMNLWALMLENGIAHAGMSVVPGKVLYLDWEQGPQDAKRTLDALAAGLGVEEPGYLYMRCESTLGEMAEETGRLIQQHSIDVVMIDSLTFALGGDKGDAQSVLAGMTAMRSWPDRVTTLALDHVSKADKRTSGGSPIGSVFVENTARNLIRVSAWMDAEEHVLHQVLTQTKQNKGVVPVMGLKYTFEPESLNPTVIHVELEDPPFDVEGMLKEEEKGPRAPKRDAVLAYIRSVSDRLVTISDIEDGTKISRETIRTALGKLVKSGEIYEVKHGSGRASTYGSQT